MTAYCEHDQQQIRNLKAAAAKWRAAFYEERRLVRILVALILLAAILRIVDVTFGTFTPGR